MKQLIKKVIFLILMLLILSACKPGNQQARDEKIQSKPVVAVVNFPLYTFTDMIGAEKVEVYFPQIDGDPAYWQPDEVIIQKFQEADLILLNGADYAKWTQKASLPTSTQVNTAKAFTDQLIELKGEVHSHGPEGEHSHTGYAFTTWLDLKLAILQAEAVHQALSELLPEDKELFENNFSKIQNDLVKLDQQLSEFLDSKEDLLLFASHPVYQYLEKGYGIHIISYHWEPDQMPSETEWKEFEHEMDHHLNQIMLWEDEPLSQVRERLEKLGVTVVVFNPGGNRNDLDFISLMKRNIDNLKKGLNLL